MVCVLVIDSNGVVFVVVNRVESFSYLWCDIGIWYMDREVSLRDGVWMCVGVLCWFVMFLGC